MTKNKLFSEFEAVSAKAFKQKIQFDLKGADYNETLVWQSLEGIHIKPFYHKDDNSEYPIVPHHPSEWHIAENIFILDAKQSSQTANQAIENGAEAISFLAEKSFDSEVLFNNLTSKDGPVYFDLKFLDEEFINSLLDQAAKAGIEIFLNIDIVGNLAQDGNWFHNLKEDHRILGNLLQNTSSHVLAVDTSLYQNAGATIAQQLAYGLAHANEYLNFCNEQGLHPENITFKVSQGSNYFFEIAKLRALRQLFEVLQEEYAFAKAVSSHIIATPSSRNKTIYDYNVNMLRTTTECMSAVLGGANTIVNMSYDALYHKTNDFGQRISRNQLIILKEESYFDAVSNPADGAYYIEELTCQFTEKALELFKDIERNGGFLHQLKEGTIQRKIKDSAAKEQALFDNQEKILLGTNKHPNPQDKMKTQLDLYPFVKMKPRKTIIAPIIPRRLAEEMEQERLNQEV